MFIGVAFLVYSFRLSAHHLTRIALLWFTVIMLSQVVFATNRPSTHTGGFLVELIAILAIYLL